ncbi:hypothetical protein FRB91_007104 [Serendipita sp. 411]|nr:hypothetical protein FRB91_007104 [Serendipita sp. 411]
MSRRIQDSVSNELLKLCRPQSDKMVSVDLCLSIQRVVFHIDPARHAYKPYNQPKSTLHRLRWTISSLNWASPHGLLI